MLGIINVRIKIQAGPGKKLDPISKINRKKKKGLDAWLKQKNSCLVSVKP
jgi:hypothetical protein